MFVCLRSWLEQWSKQQIRDSKNAFLFNVLQDDGGDQGKLEAFINFCEDTIFEMQHAALISAGDSSDSKVDRALKVNCFLTLYIAKFSTIFFSNATFSSRKSPALSTFRIQSKAAIRSAFMPPRRFDPATSQNRGIKLHRASDRPHGRRLSLSSSSCSTIWAQMRSHSLFLSSQHSAASSFI